MKTAKVSAPIKPRPQADVEPYREPGRLAVGVLFGYRERRLVLHGAAVVRPEALVGVGVLPVVPHLVDHLLHKYGLA